MSVKFSIKDIDKNPKAKTDNNIKQTIANDRGLQSVN